MGPEHVGLSSPVMSGWTVGSLTQPPCALVFSSESRSDDVTLYRIVVWIAHAIIHLKLVTEGRPYPEPQTC